MLETFDLLIFKGDKCIKKINITEFPSEDEIHNAIMDNEGDYAYVAKKYEIVPFM